MEMGNQRVSLADRMSDKRRTPGVRMVRVGARGRAWELSLPQA